MNQIIENTISELERQHSRIALAIQVLKGLNGTRRGRPPKYVSMGERGPDYYRELAKTSARISIPVVLRKKKRHMSPEGRLAIQKAIEKMWKRRRAEAKAKKAA